MPGVVNKVARSLVIMSGKGGSGKTTFALSIARVLADVGLRVLLVDCDLATHGLTYFFESQLGEGQCCSVYDYAGYGSIAGKEPYLLVRQNENIACIPSATRLAGTPQMSYDDAEDMAYEIAASVAPDFDYVIFDAQAGYTEMCQLLASCCESKLFVMELDAVSTSANRVLFYSLALDADFEAKGYYQIINKLSAEDRDVYARVSGGTLLPNLTPVSHSWEVRRAFGECRLPDVGVADVGFSEEMCSMLYGLAPQFHQELDEFKRELRRSERESLELKLKRNESRLNYLNHSVRSDSSLFLTFAILGFAACGVFAAMAVLDGANGGHDIVSGLFAVLAALLALVAAVMSIRLHNRPDSNIEKLHEQEYSLRMRLHEIEEDMRELDSKPSKAQDTIKTSGSAPSGRHEEPV